MILIERLDSIGRALKGGLLRYQLLPFLLIISLGFNLWLTKRSAELNQNIATIKSERTLALGAYVSPFSARTTDGILESINYSNVSIPTLLYVFEPGCSGCERNWQNIKYLATAGKEKCRVIGLSLTPDINGLKEYVAKNELPFPVYCELPFVVTNKFRMGPTPHTILISPDGKVIKNWIGSFEGNYKKDIEQYFNRNYSRV